MSEQHFYHWLHPRNGGCAIYKMVTDYEAEKKAGYSMFPDGRDLNEAQVIVSTPDKPSFTCDVCGKVLPTKLALAGHKRSHK